MAAKPRFDGEWVRLGELTSCISKKNKDGRCATVCSVTNSQGFVLSTEFFTKEVFSKELRTYKLVERNQLAYNPSRINVGSIALQDIADEVVVSPLYIVFAVDASRIDSSYLLRYLKSRPGLKQVEFNSIGTVRNNLKYDGLCQISVPLPSLEVQRSRVRSLIALETEIKEGEETLSKLDVLVKSRFVEMFENDSLVERAQLKDICSLITDGTHQSPRFQGEGIPFLFVSNIADNKISYETTKFISKEDYEALIARTPIEVGDVLVSAVGSFGHPAIVKDERPFCFQRHIAYLKPIRERVNSSFLHAALLSEESQQYMDKAAKGAAQRTVTLRSFKDLAVPLPPLALQQEFADFAAEVDKSRFIVQQQIEKLQMLYDSLAQEYFS